MLLNTNAEGGAMFRTGMLWQKILETTSSAFASGSLQSIPTEHEIIKDQGIDFFVRIVTNLERKEKLKKVESGGISKNQNPFLPHEKELYVCDVSPHHVCLLNKYNVVDHHLLVVTRHFEHQDSPLTLSDFEALFLCMREYDSLGFYNGGKIAGASQAHKHLQLVPLPLAPKGRKIPIEPAFDDISGSNEIAVSKKLPFPHRFVRFQTGAWQHTASMAEMSLRLFNAMKAELHLPDCKNPEAEEARPYNLLVCREWMMLVPRKKEFFDTISINSIGFAGGLLVKDPKQMELIKVSPMRALAETAGSLH